MTIPGQWHNDAIPAKKPNETEIVEFALGEHVCGVDVAQVREIIRTAGGIVSVAGPHPSILGVVNLRGKIIPVIDLAKHFHIPESGDLKKKRVIVSEFYRFRVGFLVHQVTRILGVSSPHGAFGRLIIESPAQPPQPWGNYLRGIVHSEGRTILLLDLERIALDIHPVDRTQAQERAALPPPRPRGSLPSGSLWLREEPLAIPKADFDRSTKNILVVEDSAFMRQLIARYLKQAGYNVLTVSNGHEAWEVLADILRSPDFKDIARQYQLILTDIEMPGMDGLELIRKVKEHPALKKLPCVVFSGSLIDDLAEKCRTVGADALISKDDIELLIRLLDSKVIR
ncbi:MAG: chemotaxis protein CheW [Candidatus Omnitrophica bacterium]|nr:chemotaxis protein CheW [Candidatus Omnitrophota bacterium]